MKRQREERVSLEWLNGNDSTEAGVFFPKERGG